MANEVKLKLAIEGGKIVSTEIDGVNRSLTDMDRSASLASVGMKTLAGAFGGMSAAMTIGKLVSVQREFDVLNSSLITVTGSSARAAQEFAWIKQFAATTPYQLNEVTGAFVKMRALGLDASQKALTSYGNTASAMGKNLNQMIEAVADASTGEFERLKEFGIKAKKEGDNVSLTFQGVTTTIGNSAKEITGYLENIGNVEFGGAMEERAKTLDGALSNLADNVDELFRTLNQGGVGQAMGNDVRTINTALQGLNDTMLNSQKAGESMAMQLANGAGFSIGTVAVGTLNSVFNGFNWTVNALTGNLLNLNENVKLLPESLMTNEQRAVALSGKLQEAESSLTDLQKRLALNPDNIYLKSETYQAYLLTIQLKAAKEAQDKLTKAPQTSQSESRIKASNAYAEDQAKAQQKVNDLMVKSSGASDAYIKRMKEIGEAQLTGKMTANELAIALDAAHKLLPKVAEGHKKLSDEQKQVIAGEKAYGDIMAKDTGYAANFTETILAMVAARDKNNWSAEKYNEVVNAYLEKQPGAVELAKEQKKAFEDQAKATDKATVALGKYYDELEMRNADTDQIGIDYAAATTALQEYADLEARIMGQSAVARDDALAQYKAQRDLEAEILKIRKAGGDQATIDANIAIVTASATSRAAVESQKKYVADWNRTYDRIESGLVDALMKGGHEGAQGVRDLLVQELFSRPFQMVVQALISPIAGAVAGVASSAVSSVAGSAGTSMLGGLAGSYMSSATMVGAQAAATLSNGIITGFSTNMSNIAGLAANGQWLGALGSALPYLGLGLAAISMLSDLFDGGGGPKTESTYGYAASYGDTSRTGLAGEYVTRIESAWDSFATQLGISGDLIATAAISIDGAGDDLTNFNAAAQLGGVEISNRTGRMGSMDAAQVGRSPEELEAAMDSEMTRILFEALQASDLPQQYIDYLNSVEAGFTSSTTEADQTAARKTAMQNVAVIHDFQAALENLPFEYLTGLSFNAAKGLIEAAGGLDKLGANLGYFYTNFYSAEEKQALLTTNTAASFQKIGVTMPAVNAGLKDWYRSEVERLGAMDLSIDANAQAYAGALALSGSVVTLASGFDAATDAAKRAMDGLMQAADAYKLNNGLATNVSLAGANMQSSYSALQAVLPGLVANGFDAAASANWLATASREDILQYVGEANLGLADDFLSAFNDYQSAQQDTQQDTQQPYTQTTEGYTAPVADAVSTAYADMLAVMLQETTDWGKKLANIGKTSFELSLLAIDDAVVTKISDLARARLGTSDDASSISAQIITLQGSKQTLESRRLAEMAAGGNGWGTSGAIADINRQIDALTESLTDLGTVASDDQAVVDAWAQAQINLAYATEKESLRNRYSPLTALDAAANVTAAGYNLSGLDSSGIADYFAALVQAADPLTEVGQATILTLSGLTDSIALMSSEAEKAAAAAAELAKTNAGWQDQLDVLLGTRTQTEVDRFNALADATDESTKALMQQVYAQQDMAEAAAKAIDAMKVLSTEMDNVAAFKDSVGASQQNIRSQMTGYDAVAYGVAQVDKYRTQLAGETTTQGRIDTGTNLRDAITGRYDAELALINKNKDAAETSARDAFNARTDADNKAIASANALNAAYRQIGDYAKDLLTSDKSPFSGSAQLSAASASYAELLADSRAGDIDALGKLTGAADSYLTNAKLQSVTSVDYARTFGRTINDLSALGSKAGVDLESVQRTFYFDSTAFDKQALDLQTSTVDELQSLADLTDVWTADLQSALDEQALAFANIGLNTQQTADYTSAIEPGFERVAQAINGAQTAQQNADALLAQIAALTAQVAALTAVSQQTANNTAATAQTLDSVSGGGGPLLVQTA